MIRRLAALGVVVPLLAAGCMSVPVDSPKFRPVKVLAPEAEASVSLRNVQSFYLWGLVPAYGEPPEVAISREGLREARVTVEGRFDSWDTGLATLLYPLGFVPVPQATRIEGNR